MLGIMIICAAVTVLSIAIACLEFWVIEQFVYWCDRRATTTREKELLQILQLAVRQFRAGNCDRSAIKHAMGIIHSIDSSVKLYLVVTPKGNEYEVGCALVRHIGSSYPKLSEAKWKTKHVDSYILDLLRGERERIIDLTEL